MPTLRTSCSKTDPIRPSLQTRANRSVLQHHADESFRGIKEDFEKPVARVVRGRTIVEVRATASLYQSVQKMKHPASNQGVDLMATTTNFEEWLDANIQDTQAEADDLLVSVSNITEEGDFTTKRKGIGFLVKGPSPVDLLLVNEKARQAFIAEVKKMYKALLTDEEAAFRRSVNDPRS
jgi:hypothetical protein